MANTGVLITAGPLGGIGHELMRRLVAGGYRVTVVTQGSEGGRAIRAAGAIPAYSSLLRAGEVRSMIKAANARIVVNLAPQMFNTLPTLKVAWDDSILTEGTQALIDAAQAEGVEYIVHTSYAYIGAGMDDNAASFLRAAARAEKRVLDGGIPTAVLRFGFVYGSTSDAAAVREQMRMGRGVEAGTNVPVNLTYATDAADAIARALETRPTGVTLNVVDDQPVTTADFMQYFAEAQGFTLAARGSFLSDLIGGGDKRLPALMRLPAHADNAAAKTALGWQPRFPTYRAGIDDLLLTWRAEA